MKFSAPPDIEPLFKKEGLKNHESFLICPGKKPIKIKKDYNVSNCQIKIRLKYLYMFVFLLCQWHLPRGCVIKNVKSYRRRNQVNHDETSLTKNHHSNDLADSKSHQRRE